MSAEPNWAVTSTRVATLDELVQLSRGPEHVEEILLTGVEFATPPSRRELELREFEVVSPYSELVVHEKEGERRIALPATRYFSGNVVGESGTLAVVAIHSDGSVRALLATQEGNFEATATAEDSVLRLARPTSVMASQGFQCGTELGKVPVEEARSALVAEATAQNEVTPPGLHRVVRIAVETDHEFFMLFGNVVEAAEYALDLVAVSSAVFENEVQTSLELIYVSLWPSAADPWRATTRACALADFSVYWANNHSDIPYALAHFLSGRRNDDMPGGIATGSGLCRPLTPAWVGGCPDIGQVPTFSLRTSLCGGVYGDFDPQHPSLYWDTHCTVHELGHVLGSGHTHCYGGVGGIAEQVDHCRSTPGREPLCHEGQEVLPGVGSVSGGTSGARTGTVMSYCHTLSGGFGNSTLRLGREHPYGAAAFRVPDLIQEFIEERASADPTCAPIVERTAYLLGGRFQINVHWRTDLGSGEAAVMQFDGARAVSEQSAFFTFFDAENFEIGVKMVDACELNGSFWTFISGLTNVEYTVTIVDTVTGATRSYANPLGSYPQTLGNTDAVSGFDCSIPEGLRGSRARVAAAPQHATGLREAALVQQDASPDAPSLGCVDGATTACHLGGRFKVEVAWTTSEDVGVAGTMSFDGERASSDQSSFWWFFNPENFEMGVKMVDACVEPFNAYWVFVSGLTNQGYDVTITDTITGTIRHYTNPLGSYPQTLGATTASAGFPCE